MRRRHPHATRRKAIAAAKVKTDRVDSDLLAPLLRADLMPAGHRISPVRIITDLTGQLALVSGRHCPSGGHIDT